MAPVALPAWMAYASMAMTAVSTVMTIMDTSAEDHADAEFAQQQAQADEDFIVANNNAIIKQREAEQLENKAGSEIARSQREALEHYRRGKIAASNAAAAAGASGAGVHGFVGFDNAINALFDVHEYNGLSAIFDGDTEAQFLTSQADMSRWEASEYKRTGAVGYNTRMRGAQSQHRYAMKSAAKKKTMSALNGVSDGISLGMKLPKPVVSSTAYGTGPELFYGRGMR